MKAEILQEISGSANQAAGTTGSQIQNHQPVTLSITLAAPERAPWLCIQRVHVEINLQEVEP